ncbi:hypothetical protein Tco_0750870 [Tanacetum coccineum]|uniref:Uncharacterized protein n=1 Tax=Tanacetum coccineum TaxID=301880 RepID=A0ABQ4Z2G5_9ASTR
MHDDLTYAMLHDMKMKKFNLEANYALNLSIKLSSFDDTFDITDDPEEYKKETDVKVGNIFDNKKALDLAIRLKALDDGYQFLSDRSALERHATIALGVQNEFLLAFHVVCCRHLMMNLSLRRKKTKGLFWKICKAYTTEEFSTEMSNLQDVQPDAYHKLCEAGQEHIDH